MCMKYVLYAWQCGWHRNCEVDFSACALSCVRLFVTPWTIACQASLSLRFYMQEILEWVVISSARGSSRSRDAACAFRASCIGRQILDHWATQDAVSFSNLCQRLLVLWNLHSVIICSHFEYIKSVWRHELLQRRPLCFHVLPALLCSQTHRCLSLSTIHIS